jgi:YHS domain-containing protein
MEGYVMSDFNWCHGPECHTKHTVDRVRGVKGSKVLRTRKVKVYSNNNGWYSYFCSQRCYDDFTNKHIQEVLAIAPRTEALETPILDPTKERHENSYYSYNDWKIEVDETRSTDIG